MAFRLPTNSKTIRRNQGNNNAKFATTPHRAARSWLSKLGKETIGSWEELTKQFTSNFKLTYKRPASIKEVKAYVQQRGET
jgi:hypothetical protein